MYLIVCAPSKDSDQLSLILFFTGYVGVVELWLSINAQRTPNQTERMRMTTSLRRYITSLSHVAASVITCITTVRGCKCVRLFFDAHCNTSVILRLCDTGKCQASCDRYYIPLGLPAAVVAFPVNTQRRNNVVSTSKRRYYDVCFFLFFFTLCLLLGSIILFHVFN